MGPPEPPPTPPPRLPSPLASREPWRLASVPRSTLPDPPPLPSSSRLPLLGQAGSPCSDQQLALALAALETDPRERAAPRRAQLLLLG